MPRTLSRRQRSWGQRWFRPRTRGLYFVARFVAEAIDHIRDYRQNSEHASGVSFETQPPSAE